MICTFTNATGNTKWSDKRNWKDKRKPVDGDDVVVAAGARLGQNYRKINLRSLTMEPGAFVGRLTVGHGICGQANVFR